MIYLKKEDRTLVIILRLLLKKNSASLKVVTRHAVSFFLQGVSSNVVFYTANEIGDVNNYDYDDIMIASFNE
jgi:hypothetical protein